MEGLGAAYGYDDLFLEELSSMGFHQRALNLQLLKENNYVLPIVIEKLLDLNQQDYATSPSPPPSSSSSSQPPSPPASPSISPSSSPLARGIHFASIAVDLDEKHQRQQAYPVYIAAIDNLTAALAYQHSQPLIQAIVANINHYLARARQLQSPAPQPGPSLPASPSPLTNTQSAFPSSSLFQQFQQNQQNQQNQQQPQTSNAFSKLDGGYSSAVDTLYPCIVASDRDFYAASTAASPSPSPGFSSSIYPTSPLIPPQPSAAPLPPSPSPHAPSSSPAKPPPGQGAGRDALQVNLATQEGLAYVLIQGIHESVDRMQRDALDIHAVSKVDAQAMRGFDHLGYTFLDNAPHLFHQLRSSVGSLTAESYLASFKGRFSGITSPGKSGSQLYFTEDLLFLLKSLTPEEYDVFREILFSYFTHMLNHPNSLIIKIFALYTIRTPQKDMHFMVMENIAPPRAPIAVKYDLKGSTFGRTAPASERNKKVPLLKDMDFQRRLYLGPVRRAKFLEQASIDSRWLESNGIMDFSLLLCIAQIPVGTPQPEGQKKHHSVFRSHYQGYRSSDDSDRDFHEVYYMGIIDIFQRFNFRKKFEYSLKSLIARTGPESLSCVDPVLYTKRFNEYLSFICGQNLHSI